MVALVSLCLFGGGFGRISHSRATYRLLSARFIARRHRMVRSETDQCVIIKTRRTSLIAIFSADYRLIQGMALVSLSVFKALYGAFVRCDLKLTSVLL